jgi:hypothetical protein
MNHERQQWCSTTVSQAIDEHPQLPVMPLKTGLLLSLYFKLTDQA